jgi:hypothetical protein
MQTGSENHPGTDINPTTGLPLINDTYIDVGGNPYGSYAPAWQPPYDPGSDYTPPSQNFDPW